MRFAAASFFACTLVACVGDTANPNVDPAQDGGGLPDTSKNPSDGAPADAACGLIGSSCCAGNMCSGGAVCSQSTCACASGQVACGTSCVDSQSDAKNCGACGHDCVGGACMAGVCQPTTLVTGQGSVSSITPTSTKLLWTRVNSGLQTGGAFASDLDGKNVGALFDAGANAACRGIAATATDTYFYCTGHVYHCTIASCTAAPIGNATGVNDVALDTTNNRVYYSIGTSYNQQAGGNVWSIPTAGGAALRIAVADQPNPANLAIDNGYVYWVNAGTYKSDVSQNNCGVRKAPFGGNQVETVVAADFPGMDFAGLAVDGSTVFWGAGGVHEIHSGAISGGTPTTFVKAVTASPINALVVDAKYVYWVEFGGGVYRCDKGSCTTPKLLVPNQTNPSAIAQDAKSIYWANGTGEIRRLAK